MRSNHTHRMFKVNTTNMNKGNIHRFIMDTDDEAIGGRLKTARENAKLSREQVSERLGRGYSISAIQHHESGRNKLRPEVALTYCGLYSASLAWLLTGKGDPFNKKDDPLDVDVLNEAVFNAVIGSREFAQASDDQIQELATSVVRAYERLRARNVEKRA